MESRNYLRPFLTLLVGIGLIVLVVVLLVKAFHGTPSAPSSQTDITKYVSTGSSVTLLADGPTGIDQDHRQVKITVSGTDNEIDIIKGYQGTVANSQTYANNTAAYAVFLQTLKLLDFSKGKLSSADYRGYCPDGNRYILSFNDGERQRFSYWATSCGGQGTFQGNLSMVLQQFSLQIPQADFGQLTGNLPVAL